MAALPNTGFYMTSGFTNAVAELVYNIHFSMPGTYYIWMRGRGDSGTDDSVHGGLDGAAPASASGITGFYSTWSWQRKTMSSPLSTVVVSTPGNHTFHLWIREDGLQIDKILLRTTSSSSAPGGQGPAESSRGS